MNTTSSFVSKSFLFMGNFFYAIYNNIGYLNTRGIASREAISR
jgi:hypothetical protein